MAAYERLGARYGGMVKGPHIFHSFKAGKEAASKGLPGFRFNSLADGRLPRLPQVSVPFGLDLAPNMIENARRKLPDLVGRWPDFALELDRVAHARKVPLPEKPLGPCRPEDFVKEVQGFVKDLRKDPAAGKKLDEAAGKWPDYPFAVMQLAKEKKKQVPGTFLPGSKEFWEQAKAAPVE